MPPCQPPRQPYIQGKGAPGGRPSQNVLRIKQINDETDLNALNASLQSGTDGHIHFGVIEMSLRCYVKTRPLVNVILLYCFFKGGRQDHATLQNR